MTKTKLHYRQKGHLGQYEDWWWLIDNGDGTHSIEHEWDYVQVNGLDKNQNSKVYSLTEGLKEAPHQAITKAKELLGLEIQ